MADEDEERSKTSSEFIEGSPQTSVHFHINPRLTSKPYSLNRFLNHYWLD